jgi:hypothetical protein
MTARHALLALALAGALPATDAEASATPKIKTIRVREMDNSMNYSLVAVIPDGGLLVGAVTADREAGDGASIALSASDAWLHLATTLDAPPAATSTFEVRLYDEASALLAAFTGEIDADGRVRVVSGWDGGGEDPTCASRSGGCDGGRDGGTTLDLGVLAASSFPLAGGGVTVAIDLAGADTFDVAYADFVLLEERAVEPTCLAFDERGGCVRFSSGIDVVATTSALDLTDVGVVWTAPIDAVTAAEVFVVNAFDARGERLDRARVLVGPGVLDGADGVPTVVADDDPLTTLFLRRLDGASEPSLVVLSSGWARGGALPVDAEIAFEGGEIWTIPVTAYQVTSAVPIAFTGDPGSDRFYVTVDGVEREIATASLPGRGLCADGLCVSLVGSGDALALSLTAWSNDASALPERVTVALRGVRGAVEPTAEAYEVAFDGDIAAVFGVGAALAADPYGVDLVGKVRLLGPASEKGTQKALSKGGFIASFGVDASGQVTLAPRPQGGERAPKGDILIGGEPIEIERAGPDGETVLVLPPVLLRAAAGGTGTRPLCCSTNQTQQKHLL